MEQQFSEMQQALGELQERLAEKDVQIAMYEQDLSSVNEHSTVGGARGWQGLGGPVRGVHWVGGAGHMHVLGHAPTHRRTKGGGASCSCPLLSAPDTPTLHRDLI